MGTLTGLKVVEMSAIGPVPLAGMLLADMGAEVVVLDKANNPLQPPVDVTRRGKSVVELNLKSESNLQQAKTLIDQADILLEGFRPGVMERLGLGPETFTGTNPGLIYGRMTGWGQTGPRSHTAGHDINYIALTGALYAMGRPTESPVPPLNLVGDYGGGTMFLLMGVLAALYERHQSGQGQVVDAAITEGTANLMSLFYSLSKIGMWQNQRGVNLLDSGAHFYDTYETADGGYLSIGAIEPQFYAELCEKMALDPSDFKHQQDPRRWPELKTKLAAVVATKTRDEWSKIFADSDACVAPVLDFQEATQDPHMRAREAYLDLDGVTQPAPAPKFSRTPSQVTSGRAERALVDDIIEHWRDVRLS
ncbi:alpha-methylacyl-CoA racemase [Arenicella chitinivorans]|uniref:Alpha-methylacyl-CoA racemase n=1 Tax=Arenicella chitinivorans TaxID=1329800 RepID=A0A918VTG6_9GAMM|nr:CaiB/BaiF CoA-transferase family protein [Arenicella chitinivorans]GHA21719.1 alpha-methylacyl-CoA racemase [Arenicella chitinivorans]